MKFLKPPKNMFLRKKDVYFKYSTEEQWTGEYWIDGKPIYTRVLQASTNGWRSATFAHGIEDIGNYRTIDFSNSYWQHSSGNCYSIGSYEDSNAYILGGIIGPKNICIYIGGSWGDNDQWKNPLYITIRYTKSTD